MVFHPLYQISSKGYVPSYRQDIMTDINWNLYDYDIFYTDY